MLMRLALVLALVGCGEAPAVKPVKSRAERQQAAEAAMSRTPAQHTYRLNGSELIVVDVPIGGTDKYLESQKCYVWRDAEFKTASLQCPNDAAEIKLAGPEPEPYRP